MQESSGISRGSRWGLLGTEDLGGGLQAFFRLENGYNVNTGTLGQSPANSPHIFGRFAYVGLRNEYVELSAGRDTDFLFDFLQHSANLYYGTSFEFHPPINPNFFGNNGSNPSLDRVAGA